MTLNGDISSLLLLLLLLLLVPAVGGVPGEAVVTIFKSISEVSAAVAVEEGHQQALRQIIEIHDSLCAVA